jgi:glycosyltransferase involved in cell wall biosynthesis
VTAVHVVVPDNIDDPTRLSGGNTYDREVCRELGVSGWSVVQHKVGGAWPRRDAESLAALAAAVERIPDDAVVLLDGLIASAAPDVLVAQAGRLRLVVLVHMPLGHAAGDDDTQARERAVLVSAAAVVTTSGWTRRSLLELYALPADRVHVAEPGVEPAELAPGTGRGGALLCVAAVRFDKGHDLLLDALEMVSEDESWRCACVGSLDRDRAFVEELFGRVRRRGLGERVEFAGPLTGADLDRRYAAADVMVLPSRAETYGMVVTEALARGLPVIASEVGGVPAALGYGADGNRPGMLIPPEDPVALAGALRAWLSDGELRARLRGAARERRESLSGWARTASVVADVLAGVLK